MLKLNFDNTEREIVEGHSSKGNQPKWRMNEKWYKADHMGYEALSEILISRLLKYSNADSYVSYDEVKISYDGKEVPGCVSTSFQEKHELLIPFERLHRAYKGIGMAAALAKYNDTTKRVQYAVDFIQNTTGLTGVGKYITFLTELDAFFLNEDRHTNNLAVIRNDITKEYKLCPIFDNGLSLLSDLSDYPMGKDVYELIDRVKAKPFDVSFDAQLEAAEALYGSHLKFSFTHNDVSGLIDELRPLYDEDILRRVEAVIFEQMRKYQIFF